MSSIIIISHRKQYNHVPIILSHVNQYKHVHTSIYHRNFYRPKINKNTTLASVTFSLDTEFSKQFQIKESRTIPPQFDGPYFCSKIVNYERVPIDGGLGEIQAAQKSSLKILKYTLLWTFQARPNANDL